MNIRNYISAVGYMAQKTYLVGCGRAKKSILPTHTQYINIIYIILLWGLFDSYLLYKT